ncbi:hypothetical protein CPB86DRAFT_337354, partial [Serendipita vermifera]
MSVFSLSVSLVGPPTLRSGFWHSEGSVLPRGYMLTLSNFMARYLTLALGALVGWAASRLWRIGCVALFYLSYTPYPSWEQSQNSIFIVNNRSALDGFFDSLAILKNRSNAYHQLYGKTRERSPTWGNRVTPYRKAMYIILGAAAMAFTSVGLKLATPALLALIPVSRLGLAMPIECGDVPTSFPPSAFEALVEAGVKNSRRANAAFAVVDKARSADFSDSPLGTRHIALPQLNATFSNNSCPLSDSSACYFKRPFTFTSQYKLSPEHFSLNVGHPFSLEVRESCYRPNSATNITDRLLRYGPYIDTDGTSQDWTYPLDISQAKAGSYIVTSIPIMVNSTSGWQPYPNLTQGGDTTLLVYYIGGIDWNHASYDPIFATQSNNKSAEARIGIYRPESPVVPVICDTKYVFCDDNRHENTCSEPGGFQTLVDWLARKEGDPWDDIYSFFGQMFGIQPICHAAIGSSAVLAAQSTLYSVQMSPETSAFGE